MVSARDALPHQVHDGVDHGYRGKCTTHMDCVRSMFWPTRHTETINAWTMAICAFALAAFGVGAVSTSVGGAAVSLGIAGHAVCSTCYHTFVALDKRRAMQWMAVDMRGIHVATVFMAFGLASLAYGSHLAVALHTLTTFLFSALTFPRSSEFAVDGDRHAVDRFLQCTRTLGLIACWWSPMGYKMLVTTDLATRVSAAGSLGFVLGGGACFGLKFPEKQLPFLSRFLYSHELCHLGLMLSNVCIMCFVWRCVAN